MPSCAVLASLPALVHTSSAFLAAVPQAHLASLVRLAMREELDHSVVELARRY